MKKYGSVLKDGFLLIVVSTLFVLVVNFMFSGLKKGGAADALVTAISQENVTDAKEELSGVDATERANRPGEQGRTPLMWAAYANLSSAKLIAEADAKRIPLVELLLASGANVNSTDRDGWSALTWASWSGLTQVAARLLEAGALPSMLDARGNSPLMVAGLRGNAEIVHLLLAKGAETNITRKDGKSVREIVEEARKAYTSREAAYSEVLRGL